jgi:2-polyprenyl-3-methyl-5-hydroxy-6-metoxy-1,4-benzoquinol methylase
MIDLSNNTLDLNFFKRVIREIKNNPDRAAELIDSFSENQFRSKIKIFESFDELGVNFKECKAAVFGCWYGSIILSELLTRNVKKITAIDLDDDVIAIARNNLFPNCRNIDFITADVATTKLARYTDYDIFINTSCEHMPPPKEWLFWRTVKEGSWFAFQSNNMEGIEGHTNCVHSMKEFRNQLPRHFEVLIKGENIDTRGTRYTLIGRIGKIKLASDVE